MNSEILDGLLLGDGGVYVNRSIYTGREYEAYYRQVCKYREYLEVIKDMLIQDGILFGNGDDPFYFRGGGYNTWTLTSRTNPLLSEQRRRWYKNGKKLVPQDVKLTPTTVKHWYCGDGSLCPKRNCLNTIEFAAHAFSYEDREFLKNQFLEMGLSSGNWKAGIIAIHKRSIFDFLRYVGECPSPCFQYKWDAEKYSLDYPYTYAERKEKKLKREALQLNGDEDIVHPTGNKTCRLDELPSRMVQV